MVLGIDESKRKNAEFLIEIRHLYDAAAALGYTVQVQDDIELGTVYEFLFNDQVVARLSWNVPHYLTFENVKIPDTQSWDTDYIKNLQDWRQFITDIQKDLGRFASMEAPKTKGQKPVVLCTNNRQFVLSKRLQKFAFTQSTDTGEVDLTVGKYYAVYGIRRNQHGSFYLIPTNTFHRATPWWMPADFFAPLIGSLPTDWERRSFGWLRKDVMTVPSVYFGAIDDIEYGTERGASVFKEMQKGHN